MRRLALPIGLALLAALLLGVAGLAWLVGTTPGARFALSALSRPAGFQVTARAVEGRLLDHLRFSGVRIARPKLSVQIESLEITWAPRRLFSWDLSVRDLVASGVRIQDDEPPSTKPPHLSWPRVTGAARRFSARISRLKISALSYRNLDRQPLLLTELSTSLGYRDGLLSLAGFSAVSPDGRVSGELAAGFARPSLRLDLALVPAQPVQGMDLFSLQARLLPGKESEQLMGSIAAAGRSGGAQRLELTGELGMTGNSFRLRKLGLARSDRSGTLTGEGSVTLTQGEPLLFLALKGTDLDLFNELKQSTRLSGTLTFTGSPTSYRGNFALENRGPGWRSASLAADYQGGAAGVKLAPVTGNLLEGRLRGNLELAWAEGFQIRGSLAGRGLNTRNIAPDWSGLVNLDLAGDLHWPKQGGLRGQVNGKLLESRLHGRDLTGELQMAFAGERQLVKRLFLKGRGFDLRGEGELNRRLNLVAKVGDLSRLVPGAAGEVQADGWVRWLDGRLSGAAVGEGRNLAASGVRVTAAKLSARLEDGTGYPVHLDASLSGLSLGRFQADAALLTLDGTASRHTLNAKLNSSCGEALATLTGGYGNGTWRGELARFSGRDSIGPWGLTAPAPLLLSAGRSYLAPLVLHGAQNERIEIAGEMTRFPAAGALRGGWSGVNLARSDCWLQGVQIVGASSGDLKLRLSPGNRLVLSGRADAQATVTTDGRSVTLERAAATLDGGGQGLRAALDLTLAQSGGKAQLLFDSRTPATLSLPRQGDLTLRCSDLDLALLRPLLPENLKFDGRLGGLATGKLLPGGRFDLKGNASLAQGRVNWSGDAETFDASLEKAELVFGWRGGKGSVGRLKVTGQAAATGAYTANGKRIAIERLALRLDADESGTRARLDLAVQGGGILKGSLASASPAGSALPETGDLALEWSGIDPMLLKPWLPGSLNLEGKFSGQARGKLLPGSHLEMDGEALFSQGKASWQGNAGEMNANLRSSSLAFAWRGDSLTGTLSLALAEHGTAKGRFELPIPARFPVLVNQEGTLQGFLVGQVEERGILSAFFPGLVQESHGLLDLDLTLGGIWRQPVMLGNLSLSRAGAYLPTAGIRVSDLQLSAKLEKDQIRIDSFKAVSGEGHVEGTALVRLKGWQVAGYQGTLSGERFQTVYLPELQISSSPRLTFKGDADRILVSGELRLPELLISGPPARTMVTPSKDVIFEGATAVAVDKKSPLKVEGRIHLVLGDKVLVKTEGIDAQLGGEMDLVLDGLDSITSRGEIRVIKGRYRAYGMDLNIVRGRLYYVDGPVDQPNLDILALRTVLEVRAGVTVAGVLGAQIVKLYSEPTMPEVDILAYMVLGHPLGSSSEQGSLVATAASSLFSYGESNSLQEQIKNRLGLTVLGIETVDQSASGRMGYKEVSVTPTGAASKASSGESLFTVGKFLTPKLYLSYGRSLVSGGNLFMLRYDILRHWQIETQSGSESGVDLYYKLEFN